MNKNVKRRDKILFGSADVDYKFGGIEHFRGIDCDTLEQLLEEDFIDPEECQNCSPSTEEFFEFMKRHPEFTAHGYAVSPKRSDYRITIEGIESDEDCNNQEVLEDFIGLCRFADEFCIHPPYAWWD